MVVPIKFQILVYPGVDASMSYPSILENRDGPLLTLEVLKWFQKTLSAQRERHQRCASVTNFGVGRNFEADATGDCHFCRV